MSNAAPYHDTLDEAVKHATDMCQSDRQDYAVWLIEGAFRVIRMPAEPAFGAKLHVATVTWVFGLPANNRVRITTVEYHI